jgi:2-C-methyl-D-erythritol 4-phosphate cytidylyltransferase
MRSEAGIWAIVPAAGSGSRMQINMAKQYLGFQGKTVIEHCLDRLLSHDGIDGAIVVLSEDDEHWDNLAYTADKPLFTAIGGRERQHSVYSGLAMLQHRCGDDVIALVHDAARPLVTNADLGKVIAAARRNEAGAILAAPVADTLKLQNESMGIARTMPRKHLWRALTPQVFHLAPLLNALKRIIDEDVAITDDAQALEMVGYSPELVSGSTDNLKITSPGDLELAEMIWLHQRNQHNDE